jgi:ribonuclease BN (tRNA processing enzyme)
VSSEVGAGADNGDFAVTVLGCSGSYNSAGSPCSGYLVRAGGKNLWLDCGNGTLTNLQRHIDPAAVDAIVVTHSHPDHCVDLFGMHVLATYGLERAGIPVIAAPDVEACMRPLARSWKSTFDWQEVGDGDRTEIGGMQLHFLRTDHPVPTLAVEMRAAGKRFVYTADTGPTWSPEAFEPGADLLLSEASDIHISAKQAGTFARDARAQRLVLTHLWPTVDRALAQAEGSDAFGDAVALAAVHDHYTL